MFLNFLTVEYYNPRKLRLMNIKTDEILTLKIFHNMRKLHKNLFFRGGGQFSWGQFSGGYFSWGTNFRGVIFLGALFPGAFFLKPSRAHISKSKRSFNVKSSTYYFNMKAEILTDFQICIRVPLRIILNWIRISYIIYMDSFWLPLFNTFLEGNNIC